MYPVFKSEQLPKPEIRYFLHSPVALGRPVPLQRRKAPEKAVLLASVYHKDGIASRGSRRVEATFLESNIAPRTQSPGMVAETPPKVSRRRARVLVALGSPMDCQLLLAALERSRQQFAVAACATSKNDIIHCLSRGNVDVALINLDLEDGPLAGLQGLPGLHASYPETPVVMLFDRWRDDLVVHAFRAGAKGVFCRLEKELDMLWKCINAVHEGQVWANSRQLHLLLDSLRSAAPIREASPPGMNLLTKRETLVANLVAEGLPNKAIAVRLSISEHTVSNHLFRIYNKLGISNRVELVLQVMKDQEQPQAAGLRSEAIPEQGKEAYCSTRISSADASGRVPRIEHASSRPAVVA